MYHENTRSIYYINVVITLPAKSFNGPAKSLNRSSRLKKRYIYIFKFSLRDADPPPAAAHAAGRDCFSASAVQCFIHRGPPFYTSRDNARTAALSTLYCPFHERISPLQCTRTYITHTQQEQGVLIIQSVITLLQINMFRRRCAFRFCPIPEIFDF